MEKYKVNLDRPNISAEEIKAKQNFDQIISNYHITPKSFLQKGWFWGSVGLASIAALAVFSFTSLNSSKEEGNQNKEKLVSDNKGLPPDTPCINPPIENIDHQFQKYEIDPTQDNQILTNSGTKIEIPANSFKNIEGKLIQNTITIQIREFYDKSEVFLSGIPMDYDSSGTKFSLETAGMIEIRGFDGENELLQIENPMQIDLATNSADNNFNLYYLDEKGKKWDYLSPLSVNDASTESNVEDASFYKEKNIDLADQIELIKEDLQVFYKTKPSKPRKLDETKFSFDIEANKNQFPELAAFDKVIFEVGAENKGFSKKVYEQTWDDLKVVKLKNNYQVQLTKGSHVEKYIVYPTLKGKEYSKAKAIFDKKFSVYNSTKKIKEKKLKNYEVEYQHNLKKWGKAVQYSQKQEFKHNVKNNPNVAYKEIKDSQAKISRMFVTRRLGVFNCDRAIKYPDAAKVMAVFVRIDGTRIKNLHNVNLVSSNRNSVFRYFKEDLASFGYNPRHTNKIWMIDELGDIYACGDSEFKQINKRDEMHVFKMKKVPNFENAEEFNKLTDEIAS